MEQWKLSIGYHRGNLASQDEHTTTRTTRKFQSDELLNSLEDCIECAKAWEANYASLGYLLWYANVASPDGVIFANIVPSCSCH